MKKNRRLKQSLKSWFSCLAFLGVMGLLYCLAFWLSPTAGVSFHAVVILVNGLVTLRFVRVFDKVPIRHALPQDHEPRPATVNAQGMTRCPYCEFYFWVTDPKAWDGTRHACGQKLIIQAEKGDAMHFPLPARPGGR